MDIHPCLSCTVLPGDIIEPRPAPVHSLAGENNHATTSDPAGCPETGALGGLNPLAMLGASGDGKDPLVFRPAERGWQQLPAQRSV